MASLFFPNLMFEEELAGISLTPAARRRVRELAPVMGLLAESPDDAVLVADDGLPDELPESLAGVRFQTASDCKSQRSAFSGLIPWGCSAQACAVAAGLGLGCACPAAAVVRRINSRSFLNAFDRLLPLPPDVAQALLRTDHPAMQSGTPGGSTEPGVHPCVVQGQPGTTISLDQLSRPFSTLCRSVDEVQQTLADQASAYGPKWVIKAELSQAARNRILGTGPALTVPHRNWLQQQFVRHASVAVEPWVRRIAECGLQFRIVPPAADCRSSTTTSNASSPAAIVCDGLTRLINTSGGHYLGSLIWHPDRQDAVEAVWQPAVDAGYRLAAAAADAGFFGCLGIDCMVFEHPRGGYCLRLAHDVNGRYTMGRVALQLRQWLQADEFGVWAHFPSDSLTSGLFSLTAAEARGVRMVRTSPGQVGHQPVGTTTALLVSTDRVALLSVLNRLVPNL